MTKVEREVVFNSENGQKEMTGVRHSDDDVKIFQKNMLKRIRIVRVRPWGVCTGVISTVGVLYQIGQLFLIFSLV